MVRGGGRESVAVWGGAQRRTKLTDEQVPLSLSASASALPREQGTIDPAHRHYNCRHFSHMKNRTIILSLILLLPFVPSMAQEHDDERVLICYETPKPHFNGGDANDFKNWVDKHKCYPEEAKKSRIEGRVTTQFTITKEGKLTKVRILRGVHPLLDEEAIRVIESAPQIWKPATYRNGETVEVKFTFPVIFMLSDEERANAVPGEYMPLNYGPKERNASFDDGTTKSFISWISNNLNYPEDARKSGMEGRVYVKFKINELGKMVDAAVDCSTDKIFEDEALRVVKSAQDKWKPGRDATGKPVALGYIVPVIFFLPSKASENR